MMKASAKWITIVAVILVLVAGCEGGFTASGSSEQSRITGGGGFVERSIRRANGSITEEIDLNGSGGRLDTTVTLEVEEGVFTIELLDADDNVTLSLEATPGNPVSGQGYMETVFGNAQYRVRAEEAKGVRYRLDFTFVSQ
ncbi:MAG: hypothetical protein PVH41_14065 [Anaerolineae bacterium]|jgi:hypothetical protein